MNVLDVTKQKAFRVELDTEELTKLDSEYWTLVALADFDVPRIRELVSALVGHPDD